MQNSKGGAFSAVADKALDKIGARDAQRQIHKSTHVSKRARRFITVSGNGGK